MQYCMALPRFILQSSTMASVLSARASEDYSPCGNAQWSYVPINSILYDAVALAPFKDVFWSTSRPQPGNHWSDSCVEPDPELNLLISVLSAGTVASGDKRGLANATRLLQSCTANGTLLKPDAPALPLPSAIRAAFLESGVVRQPAIFPVHATSRPEGGAGAYHYVLTTSNQTAIQRVSPSDLGDAMDAILVAVDYYAVIAAPRELPLPYAAASTPPYAAASEARRAGCVLRTVKVPLVSQHSPLEIRTPRASPVGDTTAASYLVLAPAPAAGSGPCWTLLGEHAKIVSASRQRFARVERANCRLQATLVGAVGEDVPVLTLRGAVAAASRVDGTGHVPGELEGEVVVTECRIGDGGTAHLSCAANGCQCAAAK